MYEYLIIYDKKFNLIVLEITAILSGEPYVCLKTYLYSKKINKFHC